MITITVNGEQRNAKPGSTVTDLLHEMGLDPGRVPHASSAAVSEARCKQQ